MKNEFLPVLRFAVCSDAHIEGIGSPGYNRLKRVIDYSLDYASGDGKHSKADAFLIAGDITNKGTKAEFDAFKEIYDYGGEKALKLLCTVAKGHDSITMGKKVLGYYKSLTGQETDFHRVIGGYHFIGLSVCPLPRLYYTPMQKRWLKKQLELAVADTPDRPVFVFHHEHVRDTVYGSSKLDGWGHPFFKRLLKNYPNVVDFSGHSHYPLNDPRSLWQREYTAIGTGSLKYTELTVDGERKVHPDSFEDCASFLIVEADAGGNLRIIGIDCLAEEILCEYYLKNPADKNNREYTGEKQRARSLPPVFPVGAEITLTEQDGFYSAVYPAAVSTDGMPVFIYRIYAEKEDGKAVKERKTVPTYYLYSHEEKLTTALGRLPKGKFTVRIAAETPYGVRSEYIEKTAEI